jgi:hypothetical protein
VIGKQELSVMGMSQAQEIGIGNAEMAFDQAYDYGTLENSIASFFDNMCDTLVGEGIMNDATFAEAERAFDERIAQLRVSGTTFRTL